MLSPLVHELPRALEPVGKDTFLGEFGRTATSATVRLNNVVALRPRDALGSARLGPEATQDFGRRGIDAPDAAA